VFVLVFYGVLLSALVIIAVHALMRTQSGKKRNSRTTIISDEDGRQRRRLSC
jgi:hypothetical protein